jgi:putative ABC transport system permease protein
LNGVGFDASESLRMGVRSLRAHALRSLLTMLGIVFGVAAVVSMISIAEGARREAVEQIRLLGTNQIRVSHRELSGEARDAAEHSGAAGLAAADGELLRASLPNLDGLAPVRFVEAPVTFGSREAAGRVVATTHDYARVTDFRPAQGRFLGPLDLSERKRVAVIGSEVRSQLFGPLNPVGQLLRIGDGWFTVVGVMESKRLREGRASVIKLRNVNQDVYVPLSTAAARLPAEDGNAHLAEIAIQVASAEQVVGTASAVRALLERAHHGVEDFEVVVPAELLAQAQSTQRVFNVVMGSIAAISLLVGGIGIMNVMLTTVTERTREIGIRRAVGATRRAIAAQFLLETVLLSAAGGVVGILLGAGMAQGIHRFAGWATVIPLSAAFVAFAISAAVGIGFGLYPALRAARLDPIAALRFE